jgi:preprotein translocase subunit SecA
LFLNSTYVIIQVNEKLFPCQLSKKNTEFAENAVQLAVKTWGKRSLTELEAEERLSYSCEKVTFCWWLA